MRQLKLMSAVLPLLLVVLTGCEREENNGMVEEIIFTNSIPYSGGSKKCTIISVARLFADTINRVHCNQSISSQYLIK